MFGLTVDSETSLLLRRGLRRGFLNFQRDRGWLTSLLSTAGVVLLLQLLLLVFLGAQGLRHLFQERTDLRLEILQKTEAQQVQEFAAAVRELPYVKDVEYITREKAYEVMRERDPDLVRFLEEFGLENPFPDTLRVTLESLQDYDAFSQFIRQEQWSSIVDPQFLSQVTDQEAEVRELLSLTDAGSTLVTFLLVLLGGVLVFVLTEFVSKRALIRSEELLIEQVVGASALGILTPFFMEVALLLLISLALTTAFLTLTLILLPLLVPALGPGGEFVPLKREVVALLWAYGPVFIFLELLLLPFIASAGAWLGMRGRIGTSRLRLALS